MKKIIYTTIILIYLFLNTGCMPGRNEIQIPTKEVISESLTQTISDQAPTKTATTSVVRATTTPEFFPTSTSTLKPETTPGFEKKCATFQKPDSTKLSFSGKLIFIREPDIYLLDLDTFKEEMIGTVKFSGAVISPDQKTLAYVNQDDTTGKAYLVVKRFDFEHSINIPFQPNWVDLVGWINDQQLVILLKWIEGESKNLTQPPLLAINPFTMEEQHLRTDLPDIYRHHLTFMWQGWNSVVYSPNLNQAWYIAGSKVEPNMFVLWDLKGNKKIAEFPVAGDPRSFPHWSPDGKTIALAIDWQKEKPWPAYEIYAIDRRGIAKQLTHLEGFSPIFISDISWSPDGKSIAFWYSFPDQMNNRGDQHLAVLDISSGKITDYCLPGEKDSYSGDPRNIPAPIWSPDGKYVVIENKERSHTLNEKTKIYLLDLNSQVAMDLLEDVELVGILMK